MFYSFSLEPFSYQPSVIWNMSRFNDINIVLETVGAPIPSGKTEYYELKGLSTIDIDTMDDFKLVENILKNNVN